MTTLPDDAELGRKLIDLQRRADTNPRYENWPEQVDGPLLGFLKGKGPMFYRLETHRVILGRSGAGKGSSVILPMLLHDDGHGAIVIDPNGGSVTRAAINYRATLGPVHLLDPYGVSGVVPVEGSARFNPFDYLEPASLTLVEDAAQLATALCYAPGRGNGGADSSFFDRESVSFLTGLITYLVTEPGERRDLTRLRELLTMKLDNSEGGFAHIVQAMRASTAALGAVSRAGGEMERTFLHAPKTFENICGTIRSYIPWSEFQAVRRVSTSSTFDFRTLREQRGTLFVVLPDERVETCASWLRLICQAARFGLQQSASTNPMHFVLDEAAALGRFDLILQAMRAWRGSGLKLHLLFQNIAQIKGTFGADGYSAALDGDVIQFLGSSDLETLEYVSRMIGERDVIIPTQGETSGWSETQAKTRGTSENSSLTHNWSLGLSESKAHSKSWSHTRGSSSSTGQKGETTSSSSSSVTRGGGRTETFGRTDSTGGAQGTTIGSTNSEALTQGRSGGQSKSFTKALRRAIRPEQLRQMPPEQTVVIAGHHEAAILYKEHYFGNPRLVLRAMSKPPQLRRLPSL